MVVVVVDFTGERVISPEKMTRITSDPTQGEFP